MKLFTEEEFKEIEADAVKRFDGKTLLIEVPEFDVSVVVAPLDREAWAANEDEIAKSPQTAHHGIMLSRLLWPDLAKAEAYRQICASLPALIAKELTIEAGAWGKRAVIEPLDVARLPAGLDRATADKLLRDAAGAKLWTVQDADLGLSCVMKSPIADTWTAARTLRDDAWSKSKGIIASVEPFVLGCVAWSSVPLVAPGKTGLLDSRPALFLDLWEAFRRMGGDGAAVRRKSLRDAVAAPSGGPKPAV